MPFLTTMGKLAVLGATTIAGGKLRLTVLARESCGQAHAPFQECETVDARVTHAAILAPWLATTGLLLVLGLPTVLLESRHPVKGVQTLISLFVHQTLLVALTPFLPRGFSYALGLHACVHTLLKVQWGRHLVGGPVWWGLRYAGAAILVVLAAYFGPPVSIVRWPGADTTEAVACAGQAHLLGFLLPDLMSVLEGVVCTIGEALLGFDE